MTTADQNESRKPWERRPDESAEAFAALQVYLELGPDRSLDAVAAQRAGRQPGLKRAAGRMSVWSSQHGWVERAREWDTHKAGIEREAKDRVIAEAADLWQRRRLESAEANWTRAQRIAARADQMLSFPLTTRTVDETDAEGNVVAVTVEPTRWNLGNAAQLYKLAAELQQAAIVEATTREDDDFDPLNATPAECRAFLDRHRVKAPKSV